MKLQIELIPKTCWGSNLRAVLKKSDWDKLRKAVYAKQDMYCHTCGEKCTTLDAHEVWEFDDINHIQKLVDVIGVCKKCHNTIHYGRAQRIGYEKEAQAQFITVNNCMPYELNLEIQRVKKEFDERSKIEDWQLDLSFIENQGYVVNL